MKAVFQFLCLIAVVALVACSGTRQISRTNCLGKVDTLLNVRWGEMRKGCDTLVGWKLDCCGLISSFDQKIGSSEFVRAEYGNLSCDELKIMLNRIKRAVLKVQTLNAPGDTSRFVEFNSPYDDVQLRFVWNPKYDTQNNKEFIAIYDTLDKYRRQLQIEK